VVDGKIWNFGGMILKGRGEYSEINLSEFHFVYQKSHVDGPGIQLGLL
jgi:hypothetical protein